MIDDASAPLAAPAVIPERYVVLSSFLKQARVRTMSRG